MHPGLARDTHYLRSYDNRRHGLVSRRQFFAFQYCTAAAARPSPHTT
jgi:hypothetical protein